MRGYGEKTGCNDADSVADRNKAHAKFALRARISSMYGVKRVRIAEATERSFVKNKAENEADMHYKPAHCFVGKNEHIKKLKRV